MPENNTSQTKTRVKKDNVATGSHTVPAKLVLYLFTSKSTQLLYIFGPSSSLSQVFIDVKYDIHVGKASEYENRMICRITM